MDNKRKRKNYFSNKKNDPKKRKRLALECGMKGFLCTCNFREKDCIREAYNLLNEYADKIDSVKETQIGTVDDTKNGEDPKTIIEEETKAEEDIKVKEENEKIEGEKETSPKKDENESENQESESKKDENESENQESESKKGENESENQESESKKDQNESENPESESAKSKEQEEIENESDEEDISSALNKEVDELKAEAVKQPSEKKFQVIDTGVDNVIFVKTTIPDPLELVIKIVKDLDDTKKQKCRYLLRMLPIQVACKPYLDDIRSKADILFEKYFVQEPKTFCIVFNRHSNSNLKRSEVIEDLAQIISKKNPLNKANLKNPDIAVVVEVIRAICLISIAPSYFTYKKYNLLEICNKK